MEIFVRCNEMKYIKTCSAVFMYFFVGWQGTLDIEIIIRKTLEENKMADSRQEESKLNQLDPQQAVMGAAGVGVGGAMLPRASNQILGRKKVYHGTHKKDVDAIKQEGLRSSFGGSGFSGDAKHPGELELSKNKVHVSSVKAVADGHADLRGLRPEQMLARSRDRESGRPVAANPNAHTFKINMDYDKWKNGMEADSQVITPITNRLHVFNTPMPIGMEHNNPQGLEEQMFHYLNRQVASRGEIDVLPSEILGNGMENRLQRYKDTARNLPGYIKNHPGRFGLGLGTAAAGAGLIGKGVENLRDSVQEKEASEMGYGLLKIAETIKGEMVRNQLRDEGRPVDGRRLSDYIDAESQEAGLTGMTLGGIGGALGAGAYQDNKMNKTKYVTEDAIDMAQAEYELASGNVKRTYEGMFNGQNTAKEYTEAIDHLEELKNTIKSKSSELKDMTQNISKYDVANAVENGDKRVLSKLLAQPKAMMRGGIYGGLIGGSTAAAAAGAHALNEAAPEFGMEDHEIVTHNAPLGETVGTAVGGVSGLAAGHALRNKFPMAGLGRLLGTTAGMASGAVTGHAIQNAARGNYNLGDEEQ